MTISNIDSNGQISLVPYGNHVALVVGSLVEKLLSLVSYPGKLVR